MDGNSVLATWKKPKGLDQVEYVLSIWKKAKESDEEECLCTIKTSEEYIRTDFELSQSISYAIKVSIVLENGSQSKATVYLFPKGKGDILRK